MAKKTKAFGHGYDSEGKFFRGCAATLESGGLVVALVSPNMDKLRRAWNRLAPTVGLDESAVEHVRIYQDD